MQNTCLPYSSIFHQIRQGSSKRLRAWQRAQTVLDPSCTGPDTLGPTLTPSPSLPCAHTGSPLASPSCSLPRFPQACVSLSLSDSYSLSPSSLPSLRVCLFLFPLFSLCSLSPYPVLDRSASFCLSLSPSLLSLSLPTPSGSFSGTELPLFQHILRSHHHQIHVLPQPHYSELFCFFFLAKPRDVRDLSSPTRDRTHGPCSASTES